MLYPAPSLVLVLVGCCVVLANGGRLKLMPYPSLNFVVALFAAPNDRKSPSNAFHLGLISSPTPLPPPQPTFVWLLCLLTKRRPHKTCAPPLVNFSMCAIGAPQSRDPTAANPNPGANGGRNGLAAATARADAIVVETVDAKVYAATAWTTWLRFVRCWPVGARREEGLL